MPRSSRAYQTWIRLEPNFPKPGYSARERPTTPANPSRLAPLTFRAEMRRSTRQYDPPDHRSAANARQSRSPIGAKLILKAAHQAGAADIVADRGAALFDGPRQHADDREAQSLRLLRRQTPARQTRRQLRFEQRFIRVDVADAGDETLIEETRLQVAARLFQTAAPRFAVNVERFRAETDLLEEAIQSRDIVEQGNAAEATDIAKAKFSAIVQRGDEVGVIPPRRRRVGGRELAGHAEMDEEPRPTDIDADPFAATSHRMNGLADDAFQRRFRFAAAAESESAGLDLANRSPDQTGPKIADDGFDFRQLGHVASIQPQPIVRSLALRETDQVT